MTTEPQPTSDVKRRLHGDLPLVDAETAAGRIADDATVLTSGFGSVGYPKLIPLALADSDRDLSLTVVSSGNVGDEIDVDLVESGAIARRFSYQSSSVARAATNGRDVAFSDRNASSIGDEVQYGGMVAPDVAVVEAIAVDEGWFVPSTSLGQVPAFVDAADDLLVELNRAQPLELQRLHDIYRPGSAAEREPIPLTDPGGRIGDQYVRFDPEKLAGVVETDRADSTYTFRDPTDDDLAIAENLGEFLAAGMERSPVFDDEIHLQFGVGSLGNALMGELKDLDFGGRDVVYFGELIQDGQFDMLDAGRLESASATSMALTETGLLTEGTRLRRSGKHTSAYSRNIDDVTVSVTYDGEFEVTVTQRAPRTTPYRRRRPVDCDCWPDLGGEASLIAREKAKTPVQGDISGFILPVIGPKVVVDYEIRALSNFSLEPYSAPLPRIPTAERISPSVSRMAILRGRVSSAAFVSDVSNSAPAKESAYARFRKLRLLRSLAESELPIARRSALVSVSH